MSARRRVDLQGDLAVFAPEIVLQILSLARADGVLTLEHAGSTGQVFLRAGKVVHVVGARPRRQKRAADRALGSPAADTATVSAPRLRDELVVLLGWRDGNFSFRQGAVNEVQGVPLDVEGLLLECMTRMDRVRGGAVEEPSG